MTKRKLESAHAWCWYCDREFDQDSVLIQHQKAKHFKCNYCNKKLSSAPSMVIHVAQVHKESVSRVPNALTGRDNASVEIFGMQGVPTNDLIEHFQKHGINTEGLLKKLSIEKQSYVQGPGMMSRVSALNLVSPTNSLNSSNHLQNQQTITRSAPNSLPPPLLANKPLLKSEPQSLPKSQPSSCQKEISKNCILVYSSEESIEYRRLKEKNKE